MHVIGGAVGTGGSAVILTIIFSPFAINAPTSTFLRHHIEAVDPATTVPKLIGFAELGIRQSVSEIPIGAVFSLGIACSVNPLLAVLFANSILDHTLV